MFSRHGNSEAGIYELSKYDSPCDLECALNKAPFTLSLEFALNKQETRVRSSDV